MKIFYYLLFSLGVYSLILSCKSNIPSSVEEDVWSNCTTTFLKNEKITFKKPNDFKRTSRYRIKTDIPLLASDPHSLLMMENSLSSLEFQDAEIDVFVDTTTNFRMVIICNIQSIRFNKNDALMVRKQVEIQNDGMEKLDTTMLYGDVKATLNNNSTLMMAKYKTELTNVITNGKLYNTIYYVTSNTFTLIV